MYTNAIIIIYCTTCYKLCVTLNILLYTKYIGIFDFTISNKRRTSLKENKNQSKYRLACLSCIKYQRKKNQVKQ